MRLSRVLRCSKSRRFLDELKEVMQETKLPHGKGKSAVGLVGVMSDHNSSYLRGSSEAPDRIREALHNDSANLATEVGRDVRLIPVRDVYKSAEVAHIINEEQAGATRGVYNVVDFGNMSFSEGEETDPSVFVPRIRELCELLNTHNVTPLFLGGDHAITYPLYCGMVNTARVHIGHIDSGDARGGEWVEANDDESMKPHIVHFDAHPDLYPDFEGNPLSHASPFARILESGLCRKLTQFGIRCATAPQNAFSRDYPYVDQFPMNQLHFMSPRETADAVVAACGERQKIRKTYASIDLDCLDPAFAPGVSHHEPGGLSVRELLHMIQSIPNGSLLAADIVELNPSRDPDMLTARVAAKVLKELIPKLSLRSGAAPTVLQKDRPEDRKKLPWPWKRGGD
ncbi:Arginase 1 [Diplonema papillatum]|nr:Arginase 1 [Diplonema papillatum]|eukprot:gene11425-17577_t